MNTLTQIETCRDPGNKPASFLAPQSLAPRAPDKSSLSPKLLQVPGVVSTDRANADALSEPVISCNVIIQHLDSPLAQGGTVETFIQVEDSCRGEGISGHPATGEVPGIPGQAVPQPFRREPVLQSTVHLDLSFPLVPLLLVCLMFASSFPSRKGCFIPPTMAMPASAILRGYSSWSLLGDQSKVMSFQLPLQGPEQRSFTASAEGMNQRGAERHLNCVLPRLSQPSGGTHHTPHAAASCVACTAHRGTRCSSVLANRCWHNPPHRAPKGQGTPEFLAETVDMPQAHRMD